MLSCCALIIGPAALGAGIVSSTDHARTALVITATSPDTGQSFANLIRFALVIGVTTPLATTILTNLPAGAGLIPDAATATPVVQLFAWKTESLVGASIFRVGTAATIRAGGAEQDHKERKHEDETKLSSHREECPFVWILSLHATERDCETQPGR